MDIQITIIQRKPGDEKTADQCPMKQANWDIPNPYLSIFALVFFSKDNDAGLFKNEAADLLYHFLILLKAKEFKLEDIEGILKSRSQ